jgi:hypothetical protein
MSLSLSLSLSLCVCVLPALLLGLEEQLYKLALPASASARGTSMGGADAPSLPGRVEPGSFLYRFLAEARLNSDSVQVVTGKLGDAVALLLAGPTSGTPSPPIRSEKRDRHTHTHTHTL